MSRSYPAGPLLRQIDTPEALSALDVEQLPQVADELRQYIVDVISSIGNSHFSASLGVVELSVALHYVFDTPSDQLIWDVGHQAYGHKILTGRREQFVTNRQKGGLSGFPKRSESVYDAFGTGHSSTSISAALGMAVADQTQGDPRHHIAVIGDGAMTAGMAFEGLNHAGGLAIGKLLVVLNDNGQSIDPNVGAFSNALNEHSPAHYFEALQFGYSGPVDGHDIAALVAALRRLKEADKPQLLHVITKKGKGYAPAEKGDAIRWHAPGSFDKATGETVAEASPSPLPLKYQEVFGHTLLELARNNDKIVGVTPAMLTGSSLNIMMKALPNRVFDVGIAEQHAVTFSAGMAARGWTPFCAIYSSFMQRAYDQVIHDVALQQLPVIFCLDRAGLVGADGATHHGAYDIAYMRSVPGMTVAAPMHERALRNIMYTAQLRPRGPFSIRYPRGRGTTPQWETPFELVPLGKGREVSSGSDLAFITLGTIGNATVKAVEQLRRKGVEAAHYDLVFVKPIDQSLLHTVCAAFDKIITVEDGCLMGGMGTAVLEFMADHGYQSRVVRLGIPDRFIEHGTQEELYAECGYDVDAQVRAALQLLGQASP